MSQYNGFLKRSSGLKGDISRERVNINVEIRPENKKRNLSFSIPTKYGIKFVNFTVFSGAVKKINAIYRFISSKSELIMGHKAKSTTAPAKLIEADSAFLIYNDAPLLPRPATEVKVDQKEKVSIYAKLLAYIRAAMSYFETFIFSHSAKLTASPGVLAKYREIMGFDVDSKAGTADATILESRKNKFATEHSAAGSSAPTQIVPVTESEIEQLNHTARANTAAVVPVDINSEFRISHMASLCAWFLTEQTGNRVKIFQAFSAIQTGNRVAIDTEGESAYWANPHMEGNRLKLVFAESATQTDNRLELR